jgi:hypothetical protein
VTVRDWDATSSAVAAGGRCLGHVVPVIDESVRNLILNRDPEIRLLAEPDGSPVGIEALVLERSELRACYVSPYSARQSCGSALVRETERRASPRASATVSVPDWHPHAVRVAERQARFFAHALVFSGAHDAWS